MIKNKSQMLTPVLQLLKDVQDTQGTKRKVAKLEAAKSDGLQRVLFCALDPFHTTHLNKIAASKSNLDKIHLIDVKEPTIAEFEALSKKLAAATAANNIIRDEAAQFCDRIAEKDLREILVKVLTKRINIGVSVKTINKIFPGLIFDKSVMLAASDADIVTLWDPKDIVINIKYDGVRMIAQYDGKGNFKFYTRSFNEIPNAYLKNIEQQLLQCAKGINKAFFYDGELTAKNRLAISGELNKMLSGTFVGNDTNFIYNIFDLVFDNILEGTETCADIRPLKERIELLTNHKKFQNLIFVENLKITTLEDIRQIFDDYVKHGEEGVIVKNVNAKYVYERDDNWVKFKEIKTADLRIVEILPGANGTKFQNTCGSIVCQSEDKKLEVNVGTGLNESDRDGFWMKRSKLVGKIIEVEYNMVISSARTGTLSLFLPRYKQMRVDKDVANTSAEIK